MVGEPLLVAEDLVLRNRLDTGRILVLISDGKSISCDVKVVSENGSCMIKLVEEETKVDFLWMESFLELQKRKVEDCLVRMPKSCLEDKDEGDKDDASLLSKGCKFSKSCLENRVIIKKGNGVVALEKKQVKVTFSKLKYCFEDSFVQEDHESHLCVRAAFSFMWLVFGWGCLCVALFGWWPLGPVWLYAYPLASCFLDVVFIANAF
ncbi:hypothetical protein Ddye_013147 [Dipteronia dyeriana]|uniref:Uncharacterized protein n=1 Tax=Dipteronia dyeriana TaxID=168575 RepID=A0AAE0CJD2_9ROSI|nr:hypothetical protein Ddye_013147 [Dipteronia dyeriana]